jgi:2-phospho-L-lactate/phosphoenolpyruvate guanylyltransferase
MYDTRWHAIVPAKRLKDAKTRLGREDLALPFLTDVINAIKGSHYIASVTVVSADPTICRLAEEFGCQIVDEKNSEGLLSAIDLGINHLAAADQENLLVVLGDLPCLMPTHIDLFVNEGKVHTSAFLSDAEGTGSTMWMRTGSTSPTPLFGVRSRAKHRQAGAHEIAHKDLAGAHRDVDTLVNLWDAERIGVGGATHKALHNDPFIVTLSRTSPPAGIDESGRLHSLEGVDLSPLTKPRIGQRVVLSPRNSQ